MQSLRILDLQEHRHSLSPDLKSPRVADGSGHVEICTLVAHCLNYEDASGTKESRHAGCHYCLLARYPGAGDRG